MLQKQLEDVEFAAKIDQADTAAWKWAVGLESFTFWWSSPTMPAPIFSPGTLRAWEKWLASPTWGDVPTPEDNSVEDQFYADAQTLLHRTREARQALDAAWPCQYPYPVLFRTQERLYVSANRIRGLI